MTATVCNTLGKQSSPSFIKILFNKMSFFNKELSSAIMTRNKLRNTFLQDRSEENRIRYTKQINFCVSLLIKTKKIYY